MQAGLSLKICYSSSVLLSLVRLHTETYGTVLTRLLSWLSIPSSKVLNEGIYSTVLDEGIGRGYRPCLDDVVALSANSPMHIPYRKPLPGLVAGTLALP